MALNLLKNEGVQAKRLRAGWEPSYLLKVLGV